ncbi:hypothetical protein KGF54_000303 [Candida jiufengensis]|uniref:uncharacterized protein n=1 Tax=Candida jiufengensis TaxID=497108 RepID=UPI00222408A9|nr:uncharacterized protein KGF54_000303 [Candida jiufengensis]KAI5957375.1 hypothetical protein KGF54_000303 [Candida jiufengensis]
MSDLLNKYREPRSNNGVLRSSPARRVSSLYPKLSSLDRDRSDSLNQDRYRTTSRLRNEEVINDRSYRPSTTSSLAQKYNYSSQSRINNPSTFQSDSFASRIRKYDLDDNIGNSSTEKPSRYLGSPIRTLNGSVRRRDPSYNKNILSTDNYRISKPSQPTHGNGFLSKLVNFFTANEDEYDESEGSKYFIKSPKKVSFDKFDEVDEVINRGKLREQEEEMENYRTLKRDHDEILSQLQNEKYENTKLYSELQNYKLKFNEIENELFNKNVEIDQIQIKHRKEIDKLNQDFDDENNRLKAFYEKNLKTLETTIEKNNHLHEQQSKTQKQEITSLEKKIQELDEKLFDINFELKQQTKELNAQISKNNSIQVEMSLKERFKSSKLSEEEVNKYFINSSKIEQEIEKINQKIGNHYLNESAILSNFQKTESNIERNLKILNDMIQSFNFNQLSSCERYYDQAFEFLNSTSSSLNESIGELKQSNNIDYELLLTEYLSLKRLNELSYRLCNVKELINDCKILKEFTANDNIDIHNIYFKIKNEMF